MEIASKSKMVSFSIFIDSESMLRLRIASDVFTAPDEHNDKENYRNPI